MRLPKAFAKLAFLRTYPKSLVLRFLTCGGVDDGKSTLIGRLLHDSQTRFESHFAALRKELEKQGTTGGDVEAIPIDVAYRFFATDKRTFIVADAPGDEPHTRNLATGASTSELAVVLVDARNGVLAQARRHTRIAALFGIKHVVLAVNKIDLVDDTRAAHDAIVREFEAFAQSLGFATCVHIPISARLGDNVYARSDRTPWYVGPSLVEHLETVDVDAARSGRPFRMPVQGVDRSNLDFRGFSGTVSAGRLAAGDPVVVAKSGRASRVRRIVTRDGDAPEACTGEAVTLVLEDEVDASCGDLLVAAEARPEVSDQFAARLLWMSEEELLPGRLYLLKCGAKTVPAQVTSLKHKIDMDTFDHLAAKTLQLNEIGRITLEHALKFREMPFEFLLNSIA